MTATQGKLYTLQEVADYLKVSRQTIYNYITKEKLRAYKLAGGREYRVTEEDLQTFLKQGQKN